MKYTTINKSPIEILEIIGFTPCVKGYELPLQNPNRKTQVIEDVPRRRFHAFVVGKDIDVHQDRPSKNTHKAHNWGKGRKEICQLFEVIDKGGNYKKTRAYKYLVRHAKFSLKLK